MTALSTDPVTPEGTTIRLYLDEAGDVLLAEHGARGDGQPINGHWVRNTLAHHGFGELCMVDDAIAELVENYNNGEPGSSPLAIAERRDATVEVRISDNKMAAQLYLTPACGGAPATEKGIQEALMRQGVVSGVHTDEIPLIVAEQRANAVVIAEGRPARRGEDTRFESLLPKMRERKPTVSERGTVDYRDLGEMVMVRPGDPVMRRRPATPGVNGENVLGQAILAEPGTDVPWSTESRGVSVDERDENILIAAVAGRPVLIEGGVQVEDTVRVQNVDLSTGNLAFDGSIQIDQDVKVGMRVRATGNVKINGSVEAAIIEADGDIIINGGVIGYGEVRDDEGRLNRNIAHIKAGGRVAAHFVQNALVEAYGEILITRTIAHSEVTSNKIIQVGKSGAKVGNIIGGVTRALTLVRAQTLGSPAGVTTRIEVGVDPQLQEELDLLEMELTPKKEDLTRLVRLITEINKNATKFPKSTRERAQQSFTQLKKEITQLGKRREQLRTRLKLIEGARIVAERAIHGGVELRIADALREIRQDLKGEQFGLCGEEVDVIKEA